MAKSKKVIIEVGTEVIGDARFYWVGHYHVTEIVRTLFRDQVPQEEGSTFYTLRRRKPGTGFGYDDQLRTAFGIVRASTGNTDYYQFVGLNKWYCSELADLLHIHMKPGEIRLYDVLEVEAPE